MFAFPIIIIIGMYVWLFTLYPVQWGLKKLPFVEQTRIREISASDYSNIKYKHPKLYTAIIREFGGTKAAIDFEDLQKLTVQNKYQQKHLYRPQIENRSI